MQKLIDIRSIIVALVTITGAALSSCSDSASEPAEPDIPQVTAQYILGLYVQTGDNAGSRAPSGDYDPGMGYENYIDVPNEDFKVAIFTADAVNTADDGTLICEATDVKVTPQESGVGSKRWLLEFQIPATAHDAIDGHSIKVVMMANWRGSYPTLVEGIKLSELFLKSSATDYSTGLPGPVLTADDKIAMFGVCQYDDVQLVPNWSTILDERLHLLRALAKIEVWDSPESTAKISSVSLTRYMDKAMPLPAGVTHQNDYVKNEYDKDYGPGPSLPVSYTEITTPVSLTQASDGHYIIYVPEYQNFNDAGVFAEDVRSRLELTYGDGTKHYVEFAYYKNPTNPSTEGPQSVIDISKGKNGYFNILRNYWYQFEITKDREVKVQVVPYAEYELKPGFGIMVDTDRYIPIVIEETISDGTIVEKTIYYDPKTGLYYDEDRVTPIANPYPGLDAITGRGIFSDSDFNILYYYDYKNGVYYGPDNINAIKNPYSNESYDIETGITDVCTLDGHRYYYYRALDRKFFAPTNINKEVTVELLKDSNGIAKSGQLHFTDITTQNNYYYNVLTATFYSDEMLTVKIADPFNI